jgi:hypothetical protein
MIVFSVVRLFAENMPKKIKKPEPTPASNFPPHHPEAIASMADAMPWKTKVRFFEVEAYAAGIAKLYDRGYSYEEITKWLNERLADKLGGKTIKRGQVYRVYQQWLHLQDPLQEGFGVPHISDEEADVKSANSDQKPRETEEEIKP